jgi:hypothetical protein
LGKPSAFLARNECNTLFFKSSLYFRELCRIKRRSALARRPEDRRCALCGHEAYTWWLISPAARSPGGHSLWTIGGEAIGIDEI